MDLDDTTEAVINHVRDEVKNIKNSLSEYTKKEKSRKRKPDTAELVENDKRIKQEMERITEKCRIIF
jgi:hypothetical protein